MFFGQFIVAGNRFISFAFCFHFGGIFGREDQGHMF